MIWPRYRMDHFTFNKVKTCEWFQHALILHYFMLACNWWFLTTSRQQVIQLSPSSFVWFSWAGDADRDLDFSRDGDRLFSAGDLDLDLDFFWGDLDFDLDLDLLWLLLWRRPRERDLERLRDREWDLLRDRLRLRDRLLLRLKHIQNTLLKFSIML